MLTSPFNGTDRSTALVPIVIVVVIVVTALPNFLQLVALPLGLLTVLTMLALGSFQLFLSFMDPLLALLIIPVECPYRRSCEEAANDQS